MASLVNIIGGALQGAGAGVTAMAAAAKEREGEAWRRAYQERVFGLQKEQFGLQQDQFAFNQEQAGIENERAAAQFEFQQQQHDDNVDYRNKTLDLENARLQADISEADMENMVRLSTVIDPVSGEPTLDKFMLSGRIQYRQQFGGEKPTEAEMLLYMHSHDRPELRQFVRGQEYDWPEIAQMVNIMYPDEPDFMFALKSTRNSLKAVKGIVPEGDPPADMVRPVEDPGLPTADGATRPTRPTPTTGAPDTGREPQQQVPFMDLTEIGLGIPPAGPRQPGQSGGMGATPHMDLTEIGLGIPPASGTPLVSSRGASGGMGATPPMDLTEIGLGIPPGAQPGLVGSLPPSGRPDPSTPAQPVRANMFAQPSEGAPAEQPPAAFSGPVEPPPPMDLTELGLGLKAVIDAGLVETPRPTTQAKPKRTGKKRVEREVPEEIRAELSTEDYSWEDIKVLADSTPGIGGRGMARSDVLKELRDRLEAMGARVPAGNPPE